MDKKTKKALCGTCGIETNCETIVYDSNRSCDNYVDGTNPDEVILLVTKCLGCNKYTVSEVTRCDHNIEEDEYGTWYIIPSIKILYPTDYNGSNITSREEFIKSFNKKIEKNDSCVPPKILLILRECLDAYKFGLNTLSTVGLRMIIDAICQEKENNGEISKAKRDELLEKGHISKNQKKILEKIVDFGNDAAHQFKCLKNKDIESCLDAIESILNNIYHLQEINKKLPDSKNNRR
ncbi:DUF4145 domain-containing protein [Akkermansia biwaensis]